MQNYSINCGYNIGKLDNTVYLIPESDFSADYSVDSSSLQCISISSLHIRKVVCDAVSFSEQMNSGKVFSYTSTVTLTFRNALEGEIIDKLRQLVENDWFVVFKDDRYQYIQNVEFPSIATFTVAFSDTESPKIAVTFTCNSNLPMMRVANAVSHNNVFIDGGCGYTGGELARIRLNERANTFIAEGVNSQISNVRYYYKFADIDFNKGSLNYTYSYDGTAYSSTLSFTIPLSAFNFYFHYGLAEFRNNRYSMILNTKENWTIASGRDFGLSPTFSISAGDGEGTITITMTESSNKEALWDDEDVLPVKETDFFYVPVDRETFLFKDGTPLEKYTCVSDTQAIWTMAEVRTAMDRLSDKYVVLDGYEDLIGGMGTGSIDEEYDFPTIVGTYTYDDEIGSQLVFNSNVCAYGGECGFAVSPKTFFTFDGEGSTETDIKGFCDWEITDIPDFISISPTSGDGGTLYTLTVECTEEATGEALMDTATLTIGGKTIPMTFILQESQNWIARRSVSCSGAPQKVMFYWSQPPSPNQVAVIDGSPEVMGIEIKFGQILVEIPRNITGSTRTLTVTVKRTDTNVTQVLSIVQSSGIETWYADGTICDNTDLYEKEVLRYVYSDSVYEDGYETRLGDLIAHDAPQCMQATNEWTGNEDTRGTVITPSGYWNIPGDGSCGCDRAPYPNTLYRFERNILSYDGTHWYNNTQAVDIPKKYEGYPFRATVIEYGSKRCLPTVLTYTYGFWEAAPVNLLDTDEIEVQGDASSHVLLIKFSNSVYAQVRELYLNGELIDENMSSGDVIIDTEWFTATYSGGSYSNGQFYVTMKFKDWGGEGSRQFDFTLTDGEGNVNITTHVTQLAKEFIFALDNQGEDEVTGIDFTNGYTGRIYVIPRVISYDFRYEASETEATGWYSVADRAIPNYIDLDISQADVAGIPNDAVIRVTNFYTGTVRELKFTKN